MDTANAQTGMVKPAEYVTVDAGRWKAIAYLLRQLALLIDEAICEGDERRIGIPKTDRRSGAKTER